MREDIKPLKGNMQIKKTSQNHYGFTDTKRTLAWETTVKKMKYFQLLYLEEFGTVAVCSVCTYQGTGLVSSSRT